MGGVEAKPDANQRGHAAQMRQMDDNRGRTMLNSGERQFVNTVIHSRSENYSPQYDSRLKDLIRTILTVLKVVHEGEKPVLNLVHF